MSTLRVLDLARARRRTSGEDGIAMIMAIGIMMVVSALVVAATAYAINGLGQSSRRTSFEQSLAVAENGIDQTMAALQKQYSASFTDYPVPNTTSGTGLGCTMASVTGYQFPAVLGAATVSNANGDFVAAGGRTAEDNERVWARQKLDALRSAGCTKTGPSGEYVILKPKSPTGSAGKYGKIYSLGAVPGFAATGAHTRLLKSEYIFTPYRPSNAILTSSDLSFQGNFLIGQAAGTTGNVASVHSNGSISVTGNAGTVLGSVSATGTVSGSISASGGIQSNTARQTVPVVSARAFYNEAATAGPSVLATWYDLCSNGQVRPYSSAGPCQSATMLASGSFNNWTWDGSRTWEAGTNVPAGTYYVDEGNVTNGNGNGSEPKFTVIASSRNPDNCSSKRYGNINWDHYDLVTPAYPNMWMYADGDVQVTANIRIGSATAPVASGGIIAGDQTYLYTQSNSAVGAVVAADQCKATQPSDSLVSTNTVHSDLYYDANADLPLSTVITNTLWLDYSG